MPKFAKINGTPWHVEQVHNEDENDPRRHRKRCIYFDKDARHCKKQYGMCVGAAHCKYYKEKKPDLVADKAVNMPVSIDKRETSKTGSPGRLELNGPVKSYVGQRVLHMKFGLGLVIAQDDENRIKVRFANGEGKEFSTPGCFETYLFIVD